MLLLIFLSDWGFLMWPGPHPRRTVLVEAEYRHAEV